MDKKVLMTVLSLGGMILTAAGTLINGYVGDQKSEEKMRAIAKEVYEASANVEK